MEIILLITKRKLKIGKSTIFGLHVDEPQRYGVAEFDNNGNVVGIKEKPNIPVSNFAIVGLYFYTNNVVEIAKKIKPSSRGELEITTVNEEFLKQKNLKVVLLDNKFSWFDSGTHDSLLEAGRFVKNIEKKHDIKIACIEEIAYKLGYINKSQLKKLSESLKNNEYGKFILKNIEKWSL